MPAFQSYSLIIGYSSEKYAFVIPSVFLVFSFICIIYTIFHFYLKTELLSILAIICVFTIGGFGWLGFFSLESRKDPSCDYIKSYSSKFKTGWGNILLHCFLSLRSTLYSFPLIVSSISCLITYVSSNKHSSSDTRILKLSTILISLIYIVHKDIFLPSCLFMAFFFIISYRNNLIIIHDLISAFVLFISVLFLQIVFSPSNVFPKYEPIWVHYSENGYFFAPFLFFINSIGLYFVQFVISLFFIKDFSMRLFFVPSIVSLIYGLLFSYTNPYYNMCVIYPLWSIIAVSAIFSGAINILRLIKDDEKRGAVFSLFTIVLFLNVFSGFLSIIKNINQTKEIQCWEHRDASEWIKKHTTINDVFISYYSPFELVSSITGRCLFSVDLKSSKNLLFGTNRFDIVRDLMINPNTTSNVAGIVKFYVESKEVPEPMHLKNFDQEKWKRVFKNDLISIYKILS